MYYIWSTRNTCVVSAPTLFYLLRRRHHCHVFSLLTLTGPVNFVASMENMFRESTARRNINTCNLTILESETFKSVISICHFTKGMQHQYQGIREYENGILRLSYRGRSSLFVIKEPTNRLLRGVINKNRKNI